MHMNIVTLSFLLVVQVVCGLAVASIVTLEVSLAFSAPDHVVAACYKDYDN